MEMGQSMRKVTGSRFHALVLLVFAVLQVDGFVPSPITQRWNLAAPSGSLDQQRLPFSITAAGRRTALSAGFGGGADKDKKGKKKKKEIKIKPKQQWDRYTGDLKKETAYRVAIKVEGKASDQWLEVGNVKSKGGEYTKASVARQRALIAEHARRLFPLQVSQKDKIEWAFLDEDDEEWILVDKAVLDDGIPDGFEKIIGFEGRPDPSTGYYCVYNEGKLVNSDDDINNTPGGRASKRPGAF